jgi:hypothetical protein
MKFILLVVVIFSLFSCSKKENIYTLQIIYNNGDIDTVQSNCVEYYDGCIYFRNHPNNIFKRNIKQLACSVRKYNVLKGQSKVNENSY